MTLFTSIVFVTVILEKSVNYFSVENTILSFTNAERVRLIQLCVDFRVYTYDVQYCNSDDMPIFVWPIPYYILIVISFPIVYVIPYIIIYMIL